jgi:hypothetical protein
MDRQNKKNPFFVAVGVDITIRLTANGLSPGGSGYNACT